jgi:hypothetical protein
MAWADGAKVSLVERYYQIGTNPFGQGHDRRIDATEWEVRVALDQFGNPLPVIGMRILDIEAGETTQECGFRSGAHALGE